MTPVLHYPCDALIDQSRYIGSDPVGHSCHRNGTQEYRIPTCLGIYWIVCPECLAMLATSPERITLPLWRAKRDGSTDATDMLRLAWNTVMANLAHKEEDHLARDVTGLTD